MASGGCSRGVACGLLIAVAPLVAEHGLHNAQASLTCSMWNLPGAGIEPMPPALARGFLTTEPPGKSPQIFLRQQMSHVSLGNGGISGGRKAIRPGDGSRWILSSLLFCHAVASSSLRPHEPQLARLPCPFHLPESAQTHVHSDWLLRHSLFPLGPSVYTFPAPTHGGKVTKGIKLV